LCTDNEELNTKRWRAIIREAVILETLDSKHVIKSIELIRTGNHLYLVQEFCNGGTVQELLDKKKRFTEKEARMILKQILVGFIHLYDNSVVHRDLKLDNLLIHFPE